MGGVDRREGQTTGMEAVEGGGWEETTPSITGAVWNGM